MTLIVIVIINLTKFLVLYLSLPNSSLEIVSVLTSGLIWSLQDAL